MIQYSFSSPAYVFGTNLFKIGSGIWTLEMGITG